MRSRGAANNKIAIADQFVSSASILFEVRQSPAVPADDLHHLFAWDTVHWEVRFRR
jgi:hypothetical protein